MSSELTAPNKSVPPQATVAQSKENLDTAIKAHAPTRPGLPAFQKELVESNKCSTPLLATKTLPANHGDTEYHVGDFVLEESQIVITSHRPPPLEAFITKSSIAINNNDNQVLNKNKEPTNANVS